MELKDVKENAMVLVIKTKNGDDVIGYAGGNADMRFFQENALILFHPMKLSAVSQMTESGVSTSYLPSLYFPYGDPYQSFPISFIAQQTVANTFYRRFYIKLIGELVSQDAERRERIEKAFDQQEAVEIISNNQSTLVYPEKNTLQ